MGIIDDYYGGYESLALFTDEDGCVDFEAAYDAQLPDYHDDDNYYGIDPFDRAVDYKLKQVLKERPVLEGWSDTGKVTMAGKPIWEGSCSVCTTHTTVPFVPREGLELPRCEGCHATYIEKKPSRKRGNGRRGSRPSKAGQSRAGSSAAAAASSSKAAGARSKAAEQASDAGDAANVVPADPTQSHAHSATTHESA